MSKKIYFWDIMDMLLSYHELPFWGMGMFRLRQVGGGFWRGARGRDLLLKSFASSFIFLFHFVIIVHLMNVFNLFSDAGGKYETYNGVNIGLKWKVEHEGGQIQRCSICCLLLLRTLRIPMWQEMYFKRLFPNDDDKDWPWADSKYKMLNVNLQWQRMKWKN